MDKSNRKQCVNLTTVTIPVWRGGRVVEGARLESVCSSNTTAGSNPVLSAKYACRSNTTLCQD